MAYSMLYYHTNYQFLKFTQLINKKNYGTLLALYHGINMYVMEQSLCFPGESVYLS
jgi:hypothetical protein